MTLINFVFLKIEMNKYLPGSVFRAGEPAPDDDMCTLVAGGGPGCFLAMVTIKI